MHYLGLKEFPVRICDAFKGTLDWILVNVFQLIPIEFGTVFELGVQRLETSEQLEIQYSQALAKPERETFLHNRSVRSTY